MAVTVNSVQFRNRLKNFIRELPNIADTSIVAVARFSVDRVASNVRSSWADNNQVGFDLDNFVRIISRLDALPDGVGALDVERMGTLDDLNQIKGTPGLWHQGTRQGEKFGTFLNQMGMFFDQVQDLEQKRRARWGGKEPQWYLIENGTLGMGAYAPQPPKLTINNTLMATAPRAFATYADTATRLLRSRGILR